MQDAPSWPPPHPQKILQQPPQQQHQKPLEKLLQISQQQLLEKLSLNAWRVLKVSCILLQQGIRVHCFHLQLSCPA